MSMQKIKQSYDNLIEAFKEAGIALNESQKESLDTFMLNLESKINETRDLAIRETKRIVESRLDKQYKEVIENIIKNQDNIMTISGKLQSKITSINESKKMADKLDEYISEFVNEVVPQKNVVDYTKMKRQEELLESLKELLAVKADEKNAELAKENETLKEKCAELEEKMACAVKEEEEKTEEKKEEEETPVETPNTETSDTEEKVEEPTEDDKNDEEAQKQNIQEVEKKIDDILNQQIQEKEETCADCGTDNNEEVPAEKNLEEAITEILEGEKASTEVKKEICDKEVEGQDDAQDTEVEPEIISESIMQAWISTLDRITPR